jgi:hypothetical protein
MSLESDSVEDLSLNAERSLHKPRLVDLCEHGGKLAGGRRVRFVSCWPKDAPHDPAIWALSPSYMAVQVASLRFGTLAESGTNLLN